MLYLNILLIIILNKLNINLTNILLGIFILNYAQIKFLFINNI